MSKSVQQWLVDWVQTLDDWGLFAPQGRGITARLAALELLHPIITKRNPSLAFGSLVQLSAIRQYLEDLEKNRDVVRELLNLAREGLNELVAQAKAEKLNLSWSTGAPKVLGALGSAWAEGHVMTAQELGQRSAEFLADCVPKARVPKRDRFAKQSTFYNDLWGRAGFPNLKAAPYSTYALGEDEQPPLVVPGRENIFLGLNRSVYRRFANATLDPYVEGDVLDIERREIRRACGVLGLNEEASKVLLSSVQAGFVFGPGSKGWKAPKETPPFRDWENMTEPLGPQAEERELDGVPQGTGIHAPLAALCQALIAHMSYHDPMGQMLRISDRMHEAHHDAMCRAWDELHRIERQGRIVTVREAAGIVRLSILKATRSGQGIRRRLKDAYEAQRRAEDYDIRPSWMLDVTEWMELNPEIALGLGRGDAAARAAYDQEASRRGLPPYAEIESFIGACDE